eukprot:2712690-Rhodomonas_salina.1
MHWHSICDEVLCTAEEELDTREQEMYEGMTDSAFGGSRDSDDATTPSASASLLHPLTSAPVLFAAESMPQKVTWRRAALMMRQLTHST